MKITHYTKAHKYAGIVREQHIHTEPSNAFGEPYVWLTEHTTSLTALPTMFRHPGHWVGFEFDSDQIGAIKWSTRKRRYQFSRAKRRMAEALDWSARHVFGDDPHQFWVVPHSLPLHLCTGTVGLTATDRARILRDGEFSTMQRIMRKFSLEENLRDYQDRPQVAQQITRVWRGETTEETQ